MNRFNLCFASLIAFCLVVMIGCGGSKTQKAGGQVLVDGKPVAFGSLEFYPITGGRPAVASIREDGTFEISYRKPGDGLPVGEYKVAIIADKYEAKSKPKKSGGNAFEDEFGMGMEPEGRLFHLVPPIYNAIESTPLRQTVSDTREPQHFVYDIPSK